MLNHELWGASCASDLKITEAKWSTKWEAFFLEEESWSLDEPSVGVLWQVGFENDHRQNLHFQTSTIIKTWIGQVKTEDQFDSKSMYYNVGINNLDSPTTILEQLESYGDSAGWWEKFKLKSILDTKNVSQSRSFGSLQKKKEGYSKGARCVTE